jgi:hypothetical protein
MKKRSILAFGTIAAFTFALVAFTTPQDDWEVPAKYENKYALSKAGELETTTDGVRLLVGMKCQTSKRKSGAKKIAGWW